MNGRCLLDTNIVIALLADDASVKGNLAKTDRVCISCVILGELLFGARKSRRSESNLSRLIELSEEMSVLPCTEATAIHYGIVKHQLSAKGRPIPDNDIWVAATAIQHDLTLVTRDSHFNHVEALTVAAW